MVHCHTVNLALGALLIWCTMCGAGDYINVDVDCAVGVAKWGDA